MPYATAEDGVKLYFEETGSGRLVIFVHEFAGDYRSWEPQMRHFGRRHRCVAFNARGYPPSDEPEDVSAYSQARAADDICSVLDHLGEAKARRGAFNGRLRHAPFRVPPSRPRTRALRRRLRLRGGVRGARALPGRGRSDRGRTQIRGDGGVRREIRLRPD